MLLAVVYRPTYQMLHCRLLSGLLTILLKKYRQYGFRYFFVKVSTMQIVIVQTYHRYSIVIAIDTDIIIII